MADAYRVLVTGSRDWDEPGIIRDAFLEVQAGHPASHIILVHGMCDPHDPETRTSIRWAEARRRPSAERHKMLGADWLSVHVAAWLGWETEPHPADWARHKKAAGFRRNAEMVALGASLCDAFLGPCVKADCPTPRPHPSHGGSHCADLADKAGIETRRFMASSLTVTAAPPKETP